MYIFLNKKMWTKNDQVSQSYFPFPIRIWFFAIIHYCFWQTFAASFHININLTLINGWILPILALMILNVYIFRSNVIFTWSATKPAANHFENIPKLQTFSILILPNTTKGRNQKQWTLLLLESNLSKRKITVFLQCVCNNCWS